MAREPQRREQPAQLSAAIVPFERALLARAKEIEETWTGAEDDQAPGVAARQALASEFRLLAIELHYW